MLDKSGNSNECLLVTPFKCNFTLNILYMTSERSKRTGILGQWRCLFVLLLLVGGEYGAQGQDLSRLGETFLDNRPIWFRAYDSAATSAAAFPMLTSPSWSVWTTLREAEQNVEIGLYGPADFTMSELMEYEPGPLVTASALVNRGNIAFRRREFGRARLYYSQAITEVSRERSDEAEDIAGIALYSIAYAHVVERDQPSEKTIEILRDLLEGYPGSPRERDALYLLAELTRGRGDCGQAIAIYDKIIDGFAPADAVDARNRKAYCLSQLGRAQEAREILAATSAQLDTIAGLDTAGVRMRGARAENRLLLGEIETGLRNYSAAEGALLPLLTDPVAWYRRQGILGLAATYQSAGRNDSALALYNQILAEDATDAVRMIAEYNKAIVLRSLGRQDDATSLLQAVAANPEHAMYDRALLELGVAAYLRHEYRAADSVFTAAVRAARSAGTHVRATMLLGVAKLGEDDPNGAIRAFEAADSVVPSAAGTGESMPGGAEARLLRGITLTRVGRYAEAITVLNRYLEQYPTDPGADQALYRLGESYYLSELYRAAVDAMTSLLETYPGSTHTADALYTLGWAQLKAGKFDKAEVAFGQLVKAYPLSAYTPEAQIRRGDALYLLGRYDEAIDAYAATAKLNPSPAEEAYVAYQTALTEYRRGRLAEADTLFGAYAGCHAGTDVAADALYMRGDIAARTARYRDAISLLDAFLPRSRRDDLNSAAYLIIADAYGHLDEMERARAAYTIVIGRYGTSSAARTAREALDKLADERQDEVRDRPTCPLLVAIAMERGKIYEAGGRYAEAAAEFNSFDASKLDDECLAELWLWIGRNRLALGDTSRGLDTLRLLESRFPKVRATAAAIRDLGMAAMRAGRSDEAVAYFAKVCDERVDSAQALDATLDLAELYASGGRLDTARSLLHAALAMGPSSAQTVRAQIALAAAAREPAERDSLLNRLIMLGERRDSLGIAALEAAASLQAALGNDSGAVRLFELVIARSRADIGLRHRTMLRLGEIYQRLGSVDKARSAYEEIVRRSCDDAYVNTARERLAGLKHE